MRTVELAHAEDFDGWRGTARALALAGVPADEVSWRVAGEQADLFGAAPAEATPLPAASTAAFSVPRPFVELASQAIHHRDPERFSLLYRLLLRLRGHPKALEDAADPLVRRLDEMAKAVRRDEHKMHAFIRFREVATDNGSIRFVAWFEPEHHIVRLGAGFFQRRFATMQWSILTPELCAHWDGAELSFTVGATKAEAPDGDPVEETWKTYYASIFNPARVKVGAMLREMPKKYWRNLPETALVPELVAGARSRELVMIEQSQVSAGTAAGDNLRASWEALRDEASRCTRCHLYECATQTVFGEGPLDAPLCFVGEQPGDQEDLAGRPFVGPAGQLFNRALGEARIDRSQAYVTNSVKHFKFEQRGKRRIHAKPDAPEIDACRWWLDGERGLLKPAVTVALGATAGRALTGKTVTISKTRGAPLFLADGGECWITVHPSFLLRIPEPDRAEAEYVRFVEDLRTIKARVAELAG